MTARDQVKQAPAKPQLIKASLPEALREAGLPDALGDSAITGAVISLGHQLGLGVVAEGVETKAQMDFLRDKGCNEVQGYFIGRPMSAADAEAMLRAQAASPT